MRAIALAVAGLLLLAGCGRGDAEVDVVRASVGAPALVGEQLEAANRRLKALGLHPRTRARFSPRPRRTVIAQRPRRGERLPGGARVELVVSHGTTPVPEDRLGAARVGAVPVGAPMARVLELFGPPDGRSERNYGLGPAPEVDWIWRLGRDELELYLDARRGVVSGYCIDSPRLATADGVRVGEVSTGMLARRYGERLVPSPIGPPPGIEPHTLLLSAGRPGSYPALAFTVSERETVMEICGGNARPAGD